MYAGLGLRVVAADLDAQPSLTAAFLDEDALESLRAADGPPKRASTAACALNKAAHAASADVVLMDLGPNLGAINRAALIAADHAAVPLSPDLLSLQGLQNLGPTLRQWRKEWGERLERDPAPDLELSRGDVQPAGYVVLQHPVRLDRPVRSYDKWIARIPEVYQTAVLGQEQTPPVRIQDDPNCIAMLKHYRSLMPLAQEARKPIFHLKPADGALGGHQQAVRGAACDFENLARRIAERTGVTIP